MAVSDSVDPVEWFAEQIGACEPDLLRSMVKTMAEALMSAEADAVCGAGYGERSEGRTGGAGGTDGWWRLVGGVVGPGVEVSPGRTVDGQSVRVGHGRWFSLSRWGGGFRADEVPAGRMAVDGLSGGDWSWPAERPAGRAAGQCGRLVQTGGLGERQPERSAA
jgi:hypothetical protein